ncbi:unnamed protein product [Anisakis simplex]|uniref:Uncharacterized protein n=1 Tax=Anisakis simplex TaxID=6269 RepID=A0A0M3KIT4_ANISI|nr:unnamed protein product [Anisakis simplex]
MDESVLFAAKHGIDLNRLEYVRQLARDGAEGNFPFEHFPQEQSGSVDTDQEKPHLRTLLDGSSGIDVLNSLPIHGASTSNRQSQRWISSENQRRYGNEMLIRRNDADTVLYSEDESLLRNDFDDDRKDYLVDETSCK